MSAPRNVCLLAVCMEANERLRALLGEADAASAVQRCRAHVERTVDSAGGQRVPAAAAADSTMLLATFANCDLALATAHAMLERAHELPLPAGVRQPLRVGLHYGAASGNGDAEAAGRLARLAQPEQILAGGPVLMLLSPQARTTVSAQAPAQFSRRGARTLRPWPLPSTKWLPSWPSSVTSQCSMILAPAARAARAKAGLTRRGLA